MEPRRVLVADDEVHIVQVLALKFRNAGLEVFEARDGEEALEIARRVRPHAVVTDLQMPFMSGTELAGAMAEDPDLADVPVMILTARGWGLDEATSALPNVKAVESKPFSPRAVLALVQGMMSACPEGKKAA